MWWKRLLRQPYPGSIPAQESGPALRGPWCLEVTGMASIFLPPLRWVGAEVLALCFHEWCTEPRIAATHFSRSDGWGREERSGWQPLRGIECSASGAAWGQENSGHARARHHFIPVRGHTETRQEAIPKPGKLRADARMVFSRACLPSGAGL